jgi:hypothetical protein
VWLRVKSDVMTVAVPASDHSAELPPEQDSLRKKLTCSQDQDRSRPSTLGTNVHIPYLLYVFLSVQDSKSPFPPQGVFVPLDGVRGKPFMGVVGVLPKCHPLPYIVHYFLPEPIGFIVVFTYLEQYQMSERSVYQ